MNSLIPDLVLQDNTSQRLPCVVVVDGSSSMSGKAIDNLNDGLSFLEKELKSDDIASMRVQLLIIRIGGHSDAEVLVDWTDAIDFVAPTIEANGTTPLGLGVKLALQKIEEQKKRYKDNQITYNRPWMFIMTDGAPTDIDWEDAALAAKQAEAKGKVIVFPIGTEGADFETLNAFSNRKALMLRNLDFKELFIWLSKSVSVGSQTELGSETQLPETSWGTVPS
jgi:uncharacterized protein YegL|tara:strand:+ start:333 stop:1001 length:669 start_codon:yes stop_codon:yes gene_type:complete